MALLLRWHLHQQRHLQMVHQLLITFNPIIWPDTHHPRTPVILGIYLKNRSMCFQSIVTWNYFKVTYSSTLQWNTTKLSTCAWSATSHTQKWTATDWSRIFNSSRLFRSVFVYFIFVLNVFTFSPVLATFFHIILWVRWGFLATASLVCPLVRKNGD